MLEDLGLRHQLPDGDRVAILVGPNGSGKSFYLKAIASGVKGKRHLSVISNTAHDRFVGMRGFSRISAGRSGPSPKTIVKRAIARTIGEPDSRFYQIGRILEYCNYRPRFGFQITGISRHFSRRLLHNASLYQSDQDAIHAFLSNTDSREIIWIDSRASAFSLSLARDFATVLRCEPELRKRSLLRDIKVYLQREDGEIIALTHASSGELALISSLIFLITQSDRDSIILIDEPENSLHPQWQREYVDKILNALDYRNSSIVIATHAPLIVTGALAAFPHIVSVFQIRNGEPKRVNLMPSKHSSESIEEILWRAFDVITPANHFVSEELARAVTELQEGKVDEETALSRVDAMDRQSFDDKQREFFKAVRELISQVSAESQLDNDTNE